MPNNPAPRMCLSAEKHDDRVLDVVLHYFGCLKASEHQEFFANLPQKSRNRVVEEKLRVRKLVSHLEARPKSEGGEALQNLRSSLSAWRSLRQRRAPEQSQAWPLDDRIDDSVDFDIKASMIYFKNSRPYTVPEFDNVFPNQKISVKDLLSDDTENNPLMQPCENDTIRYFHFPANNMVWIEEAIARYYHEQRPATDDSMSQFRPEDKSKTEMLLSPEFWKGQKQGDKHSEVHARSMRPLCETISTDSLSTESASQNLVLFMPYLHWETDRGRTKSAEVIKAISKLRFSTLGEVVEQVTANENTRHGQTNEHSLEIPPSYNTTKAPLADRRQALGKLLRNAARLSEEMDSHLDEKLLFEYLHADPPLQPRRTLDQSYYGALKSTQARDRDQVVYRATTPAPHACMKRNPGDKCPDCQQDIKKVPRLIMVDQLWMWILDDKTIITSFPRRWGKNRADPSAVHKSLRTRLKTARKDEIRSAFDLALIVVDQCSRVFFDRTKTIGRHPNLVDIFADAIRGVTYKQTAAFDQFLTYTQLAAKEYNSRDRIKTSATQNTLLNINPEGNLLKEVKDILDELHILTRLKIQQQIVAESFIKHIRHSLLPKLASPHYESSASHDFQLGISDDNLLLGSGRSRDKRRAEQDNAKWTLNRADNLLEGIKSRIRELTTLEEAAKGTSAALKDLLTLKQQQSGIFEAREAVKQATETLKQGRSIMLFTVVTIIFLPLSFISSIFGMNTKEFNDGLMNLREQFYYMFPISIAIICTSFIMAFSSSEFLSSFSTLMWAILSYPAHVTTTWILTKTGLFTLSRELASRANALQDRDRKATTLMKANVMRERYEQKARQAMESDMSVEMVENRNRLSVPFDVERGDSSGSETRLYYSPRV
ncbi:hypothetical protein BKA64DRAFT_683555 [Cadophora sp. MPI-SDFR-AT-0126]|nr:hypothetical protein BKA64DRAFT_683555 [Leotiomycetes sp. MPI-SDFR-AT-0126]